MGGSSPFIVSVPTNRYKFLCTAFPRVLMFPSPPLVCRFPVFRVHKYGGSGEGMISALEVESAFTEFPMSMGVHIGNSSPNNNAETQDWIYTSNYARVNSYV